MHAVNLFCFAATTFTKSGEIDEDAFREFLQRFIDANIGVYLGSGGGGEGHALSMAELRRVYEIGVRECKGRIPVHANPPEQHTARLAREHVALAIEAGIEVVHLYHLPGWHGMRPTDAEIIAYYESVFSSTKHPMTISVNPSMGYTPKASLIAQICRKFPHIVAAKLSSVSDAYLVDLMDMVDRQMSFYVQPAGSVNALALGVDGIFSTEANIVPKTLRRYLNLYQENNFTEMAKAYADLRKFDQYVRKWNPSIPRWIKMSMKVLKLPGGEGGPREPYRLPPADELHRFTDGLLKLNIPEIDEQARVAGLI